MMNSSMIQANTQSNHKNDQCMKHAELKRTKFIDDNGKVKTITRYSIGEKWYEIENEMISNIPKVYGNNEHNSQIVKAAELEGFFDYVRENAFEFRVLLIDSDSNVFFENLKNAILEYYMSANNNHLGMDNEFQLIYSVNGAIGMMLEWIKREFPYDTKEFAKMVMKNAKFIRD